MFGNVIRRHGMIVVEYVDQICTRKILYFADADMLV